MSKEELFKVFCNMFPNFAVRVVNYRKIGSRCLAITFKDGEGAPEYSRVFLFISADNWQFGTKLWRKRSLNAVHEKKIGVDLAKEIIKNNSENTNEILNRLKDGGDQNEE